MELSKQALEDLEFLGQFGITADRKSFKGYMIDSNGEGGRVYLHESDFRNLAKTCLEVADFLKDTKLIAS